MKPTFKVHFSIEDNEWVATCDLFPSMSVLKPCPSQALDELIWLLDDSSPSLKERDEDRP